MQNMMRAIVFVLTVLSGAASAAEREPMSRSTFAALLRQNAAEAGLTIPAKNDCTNPHPQLNCRIADMPDTIAIWIKPNKAGDFQGFQINFDGTKGRPATVFETAQRLCALGASVIASKRIPASAFDVGFKGALALERWDGKVAGLATSIRIVAQAPMGACEVTASQNP